MGVISSNNSLLRNQLKRNAGVNLFCEWEHTHFGFTPETLSVIDDIRAGQFIVTDETLRNTAQHVLERFYKINQYYTFHAADRLQLESLYHDLLNEVLIKPFIDVADIVRNHYIRLQRWIEQTNGYAKQFFDPSQSEISGLVPCSEYNAQVQLRVLGITENSLMEPILDIGCGEQAHLVSHLRSSGLEAHGMDRYSSTVEGVFIADWMEYTFEPQRWGTIISNLSFANHFVHHHMRNDGNFIGYAKKYMEILESLVVGGQFCYAPSLPFIEPFLDLKKFEVQRTGVEGTAQMASRVVRLC